MAGIATDPWDEVTDRLDGAQVREAVADAARSAHAIELAYFQGLTHHEIAARTDVPLGTVKGRLRLGIRKLAVGLAPQVDLPPDNRPERDRSP